MRRHGRPAQVHADHLDHGADRLAGADRHAGLRRLLLEGLDHRGGALSSNLPGAGFAYFAVAGRRLRDRVLFVPDVLPGLPRPERFRDKPFPPEAHDEHAATRAALHDDAHAARDARRARARTTTTTHEPHESPWVVTLPLILLAIPSVVHRLRHRSGRCCSATSSATRSPSYRRAIRRWPSWREDFHGPVAMALHALHRRRSSGWRVAGVALAWFLYLMRPDLPAAIQRALRLRLPPARQQVRLRRVQRARAVAGGARGLGHRPLEARRRRRDRRRLRQRLGARDRLASPRDARRCRPATSTATRSSMIVGVIGLLTWQLWPYLGSLFGR